MLSAPLLISCNSMSKKDSVSEKPNVLFLFADDLSYDAMIASGNRQVNTPNLDRLTQSGMNFTHCFNQGSWVPAVCMASRAMLITGQYLNHAKSNLNSAKLWGETFSEAGYETFLTGKWHNKEKTAMKSFNTIKAMAEGMYETKDGPTGSGYNRPTAENNSWSPDNKLLEGHWSPKVKDMVITENKKSIGEPYIVEKHTSELYADHAIEFLENFAGGSSQPFFMYVSFNAPHDPRQSPKEFVDLYDPDKIELPVNYLPEHPFDQGDRYTLRDEILAPFPRTPDAVKVHIQEYYAIISHLDQQIGRILDALEKTGKLDNTYIIFSADNGLAMGKHGLMGKQNQYDHSIRMPLVISGPGIPRGKASDELVYLQNLFATSCELTGVQVPESVEFKSLVPILEGKEGNGYESIFGSYIDYQRMIRTKDFKLILYPEVNQVQLFNLNDDPNEMINLAYKPEYSSTVSELYKKLLGLQIEVGDSLDLSGLGLK